MTSLVQSAKTLLPDKLHSGGDWGLEPKHRDLSGTCATQPINLTMLSFLSEASFVEVGAPSVFGHWIETGKVRTHLSTFAQQSGERP